MDTKEQKVNSSDNNEEIKVDEAKQQNQTADANDTLNQETPDMKTDENKEEGDNKSVDDQPKDQEDEKEKKVLTKEEELEQQLQVKDKELDEAKDKYLRLAAEFDNYRRRTMKEKTELILNGSATCISTILPVLDDLDRAVDNMDKAEDLKAVNEGIKLIHSKFIKTLEQMGVKEIETKDKALDTDFHEAIAIIPAPEEAQKGKIIDCTQKGYMLNEKVIRHAKVVIGQ